LLDEQRNDSARCAEERDADRLSDAKRRHEAVLHVSDRSIRDYERTCFAAQPAFLDIGKFEIRVADNQFPVNLRFGYFGERSAHVLSFVISNGVKRDGGGAQDKGQSDNQNLSHGLVSGCRKLLVSILPQQIIRDDNYRSNRLPAPNCAFNGMLGLALLSYRNDCMDQAYPSVLKRTQEGRSKTTVSDDRFAGGTPGCPALSSPIIFLPRNCEKM
jgi:hypothetical protein